MPLAVPRTAPPTAVPASSHAFCVLPRLIGICSAPASNRCTTRLLAVRETNQALHDHYLAAEAEFPARFPGQQRGESRGYPVAAGLQNLSWPEFRHDPYAVNGGRLGTWLKSVDMLLRGERWDGVGPTVKATAPAATPATAPRSSGPWHPLEGGQ